MASSTIAKLTTNELDKVLSHQQVLVIGGTAGIGKALATACLKRGAQVTIVGRRQPGPELSKANFIKKDLGLMKNAAQLANEIDVGSLDTIVFTNGIFAAPKRQESPEGIELDLAVSYLSRFVFVNEALSKGFGKNRADKSTKPRIYVMGYPGGNNTATLEDFNSQKSYAAFPSHMNTVVANEALVTYINTESKGEINAYGLNPGLIKTEIRDNYLGKGYLQAVIETFIGWFMPSAKTYAENVLLHVLATTELESKPAALLNSSGKYLGPNPFLTNKDNIDKIVAESKKLADKALASL